MNKHSSHAMPDRVGHANDGAHPADHVAPAYVEPTRAEIVRAPLGHALDPHLEAGHGAAADHTAMDLAPTARMDHANMDHAAMGHGGAGMAHDMSDPAMAAAMEADIRRRFWVALALTIPTVLLSPIGTGLLGRELVPHAVAGWLMLLLSAPIVFWSGWMFVSGAAAALRRRALDMSVLIATGVLAAWGASVLLLLLGGMEVFFEAAAMLVTFVLFGHWMEMKSRRGTSDALRALFDLVPPTATVLRDGREVEIPTAEIAVGDVVLLRPGEKVPVDGEVLSGRTSIDEALVTGESLPVEKGPGAPVVGGSINGAGSVTFRATRVGADTVLAQIVDLVSRAQASKAPGQRLADKAAQVLVVLAVGAGIVTFLAWMLFGGAGFVVALTFAISAVVIACPDALGLATPTAVAVGTGIAARHNILIKDAATLEGLSAIDAVVLDKTGTLTEGKPTVTDVVAAPGWAEDDLLRLAAGAEVGSEHPLSRAVVGGASARSLTVPPAEGFAAVAGHGIEATVAGRAVLVGNEKLMRNRGIPVGGLEPTARALAEAGRTPVFVAVDGQPAGVIALADAIKPTAREAVRRLREAGIEVAMLTGDNRRTAAAVARDLGIDRVFAEVLPGDKASYVVELQGEGKKVAMVGDGVNDAPALARADVGIAIGAGADVAVETANVVLMRGDPTDVMRAWTLSKATVRKMKENLAWASVYNVLAIPVAAGVLYPRFGIMLRPEWAALLMSVSSIVVAVNAVLLRRAERSLA
jgi:P-type Cu2+ transporter